MKNILRLLDKAIEELEKSLSTYKTCYDLNTKEIAELKAKVAEQEQTIRRLEDLAVTAAQKLDEKEYLKTLEEVSNRGE